MAPPLTLTRAEITLALATMDEVLRAL
jgi:4-aminobutyrate aminotransferase-like enzyme